ncbi:MAG: AtpZ/AtpI family protein [Myxococcota bacterium]|nr:AtpZ/AtpI family protein [Myxococcota bacterium]
MHRQDNTKSSASRGNRNKLASKPPTARRSIALSEDCQTKQGLTRQQSAAYQGAVEAALAVPIAAGIGWWCDRQFESQPIGLLIGVVIGFAAMLLRVLRLRPGATDDVSEDPDTESTDDADSQDPKP